MEINSPSKVWARIGSYMAQGLGNGFTEEMQGVSRKIRGAIPAPTIESVENGIVTNILDNAAAREAREANQAPPTPTADEDRDALLVDLDYRITLLELGVI